MASARHPQWQNNYRRNPMIGSGNNAPSLVGRLSYHCVWRNLNVLSTMTCWFRAQIPQSAHSVNIFAGAQENGVIPLQYRALRRHDGRD